MISLGEHCIPCIPLLTSFLHQQFDVLIISEAEVIFNGTDCNIIGSIYRSLWLGMFMCLMH
jgi:hypothetical protein